MGKNKETGEAGQKKKAGGKYGPLGMGAGLATGIVLGLTVFDNLALGVALGVVFGLAGGYGADKKK